LKLSLIVTVFCWLGIYWVGMGLANSTLQDNESWESVMKIEIPFLASLLLIGAANLMARMQAQSVEQALAAAAIEYGMKCMRTVKRFFPVPRD
jgi:hypothetical protein